MSDQSVTQPARALGGMETISVTTTRRVAARVARKRRRFSPFLALVYVFLVVMSVFSLFPVYFVIQASLSGTQSLYTTDLHLFPVHPAFSNFTHVLQNPDQLRLLNWIANTFYVTGLATFLGLALSTTGAYALSRFRFRGRQMSLVFLLSLQAFPGLLAVVGFYSILIYLHFYNVVTGVSLTGLALVYSAGTVTFGAWNLRGYFDTIPVELEQAAWVDGATPTQAFFRVALPLASPALAATAMLMFIGMWNEFALANYLLNSNLTGSNLTFAVGIQTLQSDYRTPWGYFAAASVIVSTPLMAVFLYAQRFFKSGLTIGSVKG
ncbi:MAG TPA: ABC transporter permease subunit [Ktedonobacterales bacterium]|nr:ABC transporter permease subunit [Ktedonobacterales bacterium]